jgi:hypothetical protein
MTDPEIIAQSEIVVGDLLRIEGDDRTMLVERVDRSAGRVVVLVRFTSAMHVEVGLPWNATITRVGHLDQPK